jgi:hypothetical protein
MPRWRSPRWRSSFSLAGAARADRLRAFSKFRAKSGSTAPSRSVDRRSPAAGAVLLASESKSR